eukprot:INCI9538.1.p1 GENE.INCI9538.1~~INCI9538.1.p1  ORF type:complete len:408 (+),score=82.20 INCI9538.1:162-1385(+)
MQVESSRPERLAVGLGAKHGPVENVLSMYDSVEDFQKMSLDQFAQLGWDRVRVLQKFDELSSSSSSSTSTTATDDPGVAADSKRREVVRKHLHVKAQKRAFKSRHFDDEQLVLTTKMKDALSHFIVRLAYCRSAELRNWLLAQEVALFKYRFQTAGRKKQAEFVRSCGDLGKDCQVVTRDEFNQLHYDLYTATRAPEGAEAGADCFYKIKFEHVADLLRRRKVLMRGGWAFVERRDVVGMLAGIFRARLNKALVHLARKWPSFARVERDRLLPIVAQLTADRRQLANPVDDKAVLMTFMTFLQRMGHSAFKTKQFGRDTVSIGSWKKPNEVDKCCPFARRVHKSNTVFYTVHLADKVMVQRCWDSDCRNGRRFFQIRGGKVVDLGFSAPNRQAMSEDEKKTAGAGEV